MILNKLDVNKLSKLISQQIYYVTCLECCKTYTVPTTALCDHTLCHSCWRIRNTCPCCGKSVDKNKLSLNVPIQYLTNHVNILKETFEELFKIKLEEFLINHPDVCTEQDHNKNVKDWLASSQNHFSAPVTNSEELTQESIPCVHQVLSHIQVYSENKKVSNQVNVIHVPQPEQDWDKIEVMPDSENNINNIKENIIGPMDFEPFDSIIEDKKFSSENPRRSSRNKETKDNHSYLNEVGFSKINKLSSNATVLNKISQKPIKPWNNVKRMKKEFSKLNKQNKSKLNVSIEMYKKLKKNKTIEMQNSINDTLDVNDNAPEIISNKDTHEIPNIQETTESAQLNKQCHTVLQNNCEETNVLTQPISQIKASTEKEPDTNIVTNLNAQKVNFIKKSTLHSNNALQKPTIYVNCNENTNTTSSDDIEITIKVGNTITNICIKKKDNDVQLKVHADREIQTSSKGSFEHKNVSVSCSPFIENNILPVTITKNNIITEKMTVPVTGKINTESAETTTAHFEITESVEKELSNSMNNVFHKSNTNKTLTQSTIKNNHNKEMQDIVQKLNNIPEEIEGLNDLDIFGSMSVKESNVHTLKDDERSSSAILRPTHKSNKEKQISSEKRFREDEYILPPKKKLKGIDGADISIRNQQDEVEHDSELDDYDALNQVFENIEADLNKSPNASKKEKCELKNTPLESQKLPLTNKITDKKKNDNNKSLIDQKFSENVFSLAEKESEIIFQTTNQVSMTSKVNINEEGEITNKYSDVKDSTQSDDIDIVVLSTPIQDYHSDHSVVEGTPQKTSSITKTKDKSKTRNETTVIENETQKPDAKSLPLSKKRSRQALVESTLDNVNVINITDSINNSDEAIESPSRRNSTIIDGLRPRITLVTPTIAKFVNQIQHNSTPVAKKSLNFSYNDEDGEETLCSTSIIAAKTTQEREFMAKAFNQSMSPLSAKGSKTVKKFCVTGSCLTLLERAKLKSLCLQWNWTYVDIYVKELTHLVVDVDEKNTPQRSVKYVCALAGSKWIVSFEWVKKCLMTNTIVDEEPYEVVDGTGSPGPRRARLARRKLFQGITFFCMPPFSVLDQETLTDMLVTAGGQVVAEARAIRAGERPALLLAEPEHTQVDKFTYLAMEMSVVPVNYEWALNCLSRYSLLPIYDLLLCPPPLLPKVTLQWPVELVSRDTQ